VCINRMSGMHERMSATRRFCVNILRTGQESISRAFAGRLEQEDRFRHGAWSRDADGIPYLTDAQAAILCMAETTVDCGSHTVFVGLVRGVRVGGAVLPLVYCNGEFGSVKPGRPTACNTLRPVDVTPA
jgi:flavin reductase